jgi:lysophospholipase L1-like esterase
MKSIFTNRKALILPLLVLLACGNVEIARAQNTNAAAPATASPSDASEFPHDGALVPGKGPMQTWEGFWKIWADRHALWKQSAGSDKNAVVFLGDSITQGWSSLAKDFPNLHVANRGISGDTTRGVLYRLQADVIDLNPTAVVLLIGTNDIGLGASPEDIADNIREILRALKKSNRNMPIIVCKVMPRADRNLHAEEKIKRLNALVDDIVKPDPNFVRCDTWSIYADEKGDPSKEEFPDLLHPNAAGYAKWTIALKPVFAKLNLGTEKAQ